MTGGGGVGGFLRTQGEKSVLIVTFMPDSLHLTCETNLANLHFRNYTNLKCFKYGRIQKKKTTKILFYISSQYPFLRTQDNSSRIC